VPSAAAHVNDGRNSTSRTSTSNSILLTMPASYSRDGSLCKSSKPPLDLEKQPDLRAPFIRSWKTAATAKDRAND
jgi:hypothetical protein